LVWLGEFEGIYLISVDRKVIVVVFVSVYVFKVVLITSYFDSKLDVSFQVLLAIVKIYIESRSLERVIVSEISLLFLTIDYVIKGLVSSIVNTDFIWKVFSL
jgi:hypothetical protein